MSAAGIPPNRRRTRLNGRNSYRNTLVDTSNTHSPESLRLIQLHRREARTASPTLQDEPGGKVSTVQFRDFQRDRRITKLQKSLPSPLKLNYQTSLDSLDAVALDFGSIPEVSPSGSHQESSRGCATKSDALSLAAIKPVPTPTAKPTLPSHPYYTRNVSKAPDCAPKPLEVGIQETFSNDALLAMTSPMKRSGDRRPLCSVLDTPTLKDLDAESLPDFFEDTEDDPVAAAATELLAAVSSNNAKLGTAKKQAPKRKVSKTELDLEGMPYWMKKGWRPNRADGEQKTPHDIRQEFTALLQKLTIPKTALLKHMGVNSNSLRKFMNPKTYKDPWRAVENGCYWAAARMIEAHGNGDSIESVSEKLQKLRLITQSGIYPEDLAVTSKSKVDIPQVAKSFAPPKKKPRLRKQAATRARLSKAPKVSYFDLLQTYDAFVEKGQYEYVDFGTTFDATIAAVNDKIDELVEICDDRCEDKEVAEDFRESKKAMRSFSVYEAREKLAREEEEKTDMDEWMRVGRTRRSTKQMHDVEMEKLSNAPFIFERKSRRSTRLSPMKDCKLVDGDKSELLKRNVLTPKMCQVETTAKTDHLPEGSSDVSMASLMALKELKHSLAFVGEYSRGLPQFKN